MDPLQPSFPFTVPREHPVHLYTKPFPTCVDEGLNPGSLGPKHGLLMWGTRRPGGWFPQPSRKPTPRSRKTDQQKWEIGYVKTEGRAWRLHVPAIGHCTILPLFINPQDLSIPSFCAPFHSLSTNTGSLDFFPISSVFPFPHDCLSTGQFPVTIKFVVRMFWLWRLHQNRSGEETHQQTEEEGLNKGLGWKLWEVYTYTYTPKHILISDTLYT